MGDMWSVGKATSARNVGGLGTANQTNDTSRHIRAGGQPKAKAELELAFTIVAIFRSLTAPVRSAIMRPSHGDSRLLYTHHVLESS